MGCPAGASGREPAQKQVPFTECFELPSLGSAGKESTCNAEVPGSIPELGRSPAEGIDYLLQYSWTSLVGQTQCRRPGFDPWVGKMPWRREELSSPVFWPGEFHQQRSLAGYRVHGLQRVRHDSATFTCSFIEGLLHDKPFVMHFKCISHLIISAIMPHQKYYNSVG